MIESAKFKKMLHILKTNSKDLNIDIGIVDYDAYKECDYEVLILHLKETNIQNGATVYKDFIIRSQLYYNENDDKYYSALDGDIVAVGKKPTKINVLTDITETIFEQDMIDIRVQLLDADTKEALKNQSIFMYLSSSPEESFLSNTTDEDGIAVFRFALQDMNVLKYDCVLHFEYLGNKTYRKSKSDYFVIDFINMRTKDISSEVEAYLEPNNMLSIRYNISCNNQNLSQGYKKYTTLDINDSDLIEGSVHFYANKPQESSVYLGEGYLSNSSDKSYCSITAELPNDYYNDDIRIQAIFSGNSYYEKNIATTFVRADRINPVGMQLDAYKTTDGFKTKLTFWVDATSIDDGLYNIGFETLYRLFGKADFYLKNSNGIWGSFLKHNPFHTTTNFEITKDGNLYQISTITEDVTVDIEDYGLTLNDDFHIKAIYSGNVLINDFEIENIAEEEDNSITLENVVVKIVDANDNLMPARIQMYNGINYVSEDGIFNFTYNGLYLTNGRTDTYLFSNKPTFVIVGTDIGIKKFNFTPSVENEEIILKFPESIQETSLTFYASTGTSYADFMQTSIQNPTPVARLSINMLGLSTSTSRDGIAFLEIEDGSDYTLSFGRETISFSVKDGVAYVREDDEEYPFILVESGSSNPDLPEEPSGPII